MSEMTVDTAVPVRDALFAYHRDTYVRDAEQEIASEGLIDCRTGVFAHEPSEAVRAALRGLDPAQLARYAAREDERLLERAVLARFAVPGLTEDDLFLGHGSFNLLERLIHKFLRAGAIVGLGPQFNEVPSEFLAAGARYEALPLSMGDAALPIDTLVAGLDEGRWSIVYIDNPNNPLGCVFSPDTIARIATACDRSGAVLVVDEAFGDYLDDRASALHLVPKHRQLVVVRSFSKALGLAGERIGYMAMSEPLARVYREIDVPFEPGLVALTLARAVLEDAPWLSNVRRAVRDGKRAMLDALAETGVRVLPTHPDVAIFAMHAPGRDLVQALRERGISALPGSSFTRTYAGWDDSYCRLCVLHGEALERVCRRLASL